MTGSPTSGNPLTAAGGPGGHHGHGRRAEWQDHHHRVRSGDEPLHARSPLRLRMILALTGLANGVAGILVFLLLLPSLPLVALFAVVLAGSLVNIAVVAHRIHQGPHYQPGPGIPPYRPVQAEQPPEPKPPAPTRVRRRRYLVLMGVCVLLITLAWTWIRIYSVGAALAMSAVAALIPPFAAAVANVDSPILREQDEPPPSRAQPPPEGPPPGPPRVRPPDRG
jgi:hypothetical protein